MPFDPTRRNLVDELMDAPDVNPAELRRALAFIRRINTFLGYNSSVARRAIAATPSPTASVLDVATGSGDLLVSLAKRSPQLKLVGLDRHAGDARRGASGDGRDACPG